MPGILGISGSPRKGGNTEILVKRILEGAGSEGADTLLVTLGGMTVRECDGCHACWRDGAPCRHTDDMATLYPLIAASDVIVFGTPVYWYGPTALMKAVLDRFVFFNCPEHRPGIRGTRGFAAVPFEETGPATAGPTLEIFRRSFHWLEMEDAGSLLAPGVGEKGAILRETAVLDRAEETGRRLAAGRNIS